MKQFQTVKVTELKTNHLPLLKAMTAAEIKKYLTVLKDRNSNYNEKMLFKCSLLSTHNLVDSLRT